MCLLSLIPGVFISARALAFSAYWTPYCLFLPSTATSRSIWLASVAEPIKTGTPFDMSAASLAAEQTSAYPAVPHHHDQLAKYATSCCVNRLSLSWLLALRSPIHPVQPPLVSVESTTQTQLRIHENACSNGSIISPDLVKGRCQPGRTAYQSFCPSAASLS